MPRKRPTTGKATRKSGSVEGVRGLADFAKGKVQAMGHVPGDAAKGLARAATGRPRARRGGKKITTAREKRLHAVAEKIVGIIERGGAKFTPVQAKAGRAITNGEQSSRILAKKVNASLVPYKGWTKESVALAVRAVERMLYRTSLSYQGIAEGMNGNPAVAKRAGLSRNAPEGLIVEPAFVWLVDELTTTRTGMRVIGGRTYVSPRARRLALRAFGMFGVGISEKIVRRETRLAEEEIKLIEKERRLAEKERRPAGIKGRVKARPPESEPVIRKQTEQIREEWRRLNPEASRLHRMETPRYIHRSVQSIVRMMCKYRYYRFEGAPVWIALEERLAGEPITVRGIHHIVDHIEKDPTLLRLAEESPLWNEMAETIKSPVSRAPLSLEKGFPQMYRAFKLGGKTKKHAAQVKELKRNTEAVLEQLLKTDKVLKKIAESTGQPIEFVQLVNAAYTARPPGRKPRS